MSRLHGVSSFIASSKLIGRFTERKMAEEEKTEMTFEEIVDEYSSKKVAALAFVSHHYRGMTVLIISIIA